MTLSNDKPQVLDLEEALERVGEDMEIFREITELFLETYPDQLEEIRKGIDDRNADTVERASHSLKGSVGALAAKKAHETAFRLEVIGREGRLEEAPEEYSRLEQALKELDTALKEIISE